MMRSRTASETRGHPSRWSDRRRPSARSVSASRASSVIRWLSGGSTTRQRHRSGSPATASRRRRHARAQDSSSRSRMYPSARNRAACGSSAADEEACAGAGAGGVEAVAAAGSICVVGVAALRREREWTAAGGRNFAASPAAKLF